jgi:hypothetical protein
MILIISAMILLPYYVDGYYQIRLRRTHTSQISRFFLRSAVVLNVPETLFRSKWYSVTSITQVTTLILSIYFQVEMMLWIKHYPLVHFNLQEIKIGSRTSI